VPEHFVLVRRLSGLGAWGGDPRFTDTGRFAIHTFTADPDGDYKGAVLSEAVRVVLRNAWLNKWSSPDLGSVIEIQMTSEPTRVVGLVDVVRSRPVRRPSDWLLALPVDVPPARAPAPQASGPRRPVCNLGTPVLHRP
jgi:hypothetical protein